MATSAHTHPGLNRMNHCVHLLVFDRIKTTLKQRHPVVKYRRGFVFTLARLLFCDVPSLVPEFENIESVPFEPIVNPKSTKRLVTDNIVSSRIEILPVCLRLYVNNKRTVVYPLLTIIDNLISR